MYLASFLAFARNLVLTVGRIQALGLAASALTYFQNTSPPPVEGWGKTGLCRHRRGREQEHRQGEKTLNRYTAEAVSWKGHTQTDAVDARRVEVAHKY